MTVVINGSTGITTDGGYTGDGVSFADNAPANSLVVDSSGNVGVGTDTPISDAKLTLGNGGTGDVAIALQRSGASQADAALVNTAGSIVFKSGDASTVAGMTERLRVTTSGTLQFDSGYGSVATAYGCRAWVNFNGTGTVAIRASGNVSSISDLGTGRFRVNFSTAMPDANYAASWDTVAQTTNGMDINTQPGTFLTTSIECQVRTPGGVLNDPTDIGLTVIR